MDGEEKSCNKMSKRLILFYAASKLRRARMRRVSVSMSVSMSVER